MKRKPANTAENAVKAAINASKAPLSPPAHVNLRKGDMPFWEGVIQARAREEWTNADLVVAAQLARCQRDIEVESAVLDGEGTVIRNDRGTMVPNPHVTVLEQMARREMALMRTLRMGGTAVSGDLRSESRSRGLERQANKLKVELEREDLLA